MKIVGNIEIMIDLWYNDYSWINKNLTKECDYMDYVTKSYIIAYTIVLTPVIIILIGLALRKLKNKTQNAFLIAGGICIGLFALAFILLSCANCFLAY